MLHPKSIFNSLKYKSPLAVVIAALIYVAGAGAQAGPLDRSAMTTDVTKLKRGQMVRLELKNVSKESVTVRLQFVECPDAEDNKVLVKRDATIRPGGTETLEYVISDMVSMQVRAQFETREPRSISLLRPSLRIVDKASGNTLQKIGREGFKESEPAELRPGNDPHPPLKTLTQ